MSKMDPVVHFEMPYEDSRRTADFYAQAFGWQMNQLGDVMGNYILATTAERDPKTRRPLDPGAINGGFFPNKKDGPVQYPSVVIAVDDIRESMKKVVSAGGKVLGELVQIPGNGLYVSFLDTEGNRVRYHPAGPYVINGNLASISPANS